MLYACGLRLAEVVAIDRNHFSDGLDSLRVRGKGDKERIIPITRRLREEIRRFTDKFLSGNICKSQEKALFLSKQGERISRSDVQRSVARLLRECGVEGKCSPHVLRHTFATHLLNDGADLREIQELMGHSSLRATQVYTHSNIAQLRNIYDVAHPRSGGAASAKRMRELSDH
jgi:integrase/recombinase XerC